MGNWERRAGRRGSAAVAETPDPSRSGEAIRCAVELAGGLDWLERGQTVLVKPALNSSGAFPFTASPASCAEIVKMCLERGAGKVYVADEMGFEHTMLKHWKTGKFAGFEKDQTIKAFKKTGIHEAVSRVAEELGAGDRVHVTTFREHGWRRHEFTGPLGLDGATTTTASMRRSAACDAPISDRSTLAEPRHTTWFSSGATISTTSVPS